MENSLKLAQLGERDSGEIFIQIRQNPSYFLEKLPISPDNVIM